MTNDFIPGSAEPSEAQKAAGNYAKGHRFLHGMRISVENAAGTKRRGIGKDGTPWEQEMKHDYGYIRGSKGKDKDHLDVFLGPEADNADHPVFVIDQEDSDTGDFDEHKALFGFPDAASARAAYLSNYPDGWSADRAVTAMPIGEFKKWAYVGAKGGKRLPAHQLKAFQERAEVKSDEPEGFAAGGAVGKKAVPLLKHLLENGIEGVLPKLQELLGRTDKTNHEHSVTGFVENSGDLNANRGWANMEEPQVHTDNKVGQVSLRPFGTPKGELQELKTLNVHSHPVQSYPAPSEPDMKSWGGISEAGIPGKSIILRGGSPRMAYGSIDFDPYATVDVFHPESINNANTAISEGVRKGFYDKPLRDAGIDPKEAWRVRALRNYLAGAYWEPQGVASYAHDMPSIVPRVQQMLWDRTPPGQKLESFFSPDPELINKIIDATWNPTEDLLRNTKGFSEGGGVDPAELERHFLRGVQGRPDHECSCGNETKMFTGPSNAPSEGFADGGSVDDLSKPAFRTPLVLKRRADRQDREGAKEAPVQLLRGLLTGTLGFGGDMEGLARSVGSALGAKIDETPTLPTGDFFRDLLPGAPTSASGRAASDLGNMGAVPLSAGALGAIRAARAAAPTVRGALTRMMENASREPEALVAGRRPGSARAMQSGAIKNPGGNWLDNQPKEIGKEMRGWEVEGGTGPVAEWMDKRVSDYIANKMGTVSDPLLQLEREGRLHINVPADFDHGRRWQDEQHQLLTGRTEETPWEALSGSFLHGIQPKDYARYSNANSAPDWVSKLPADQTIWRINSPQQLEQELGFGHIRDYLDQATWGQEQMGHLGGVEKAAQMAAEQRALGVPNEALENAVRMVNAGLGIDPSKLGKMSFADVAGKVGDWNKAMERWEQEARAATDWNKGIKSVMKEYPETGGRWVELNPEALGDEGTAMGHCVGGYCSSVESGRNRILSYRDKNGPHVTVELAQGKGDPVSDRFRDLDQATMDEIRAAAMARDERGIDWGPQGAFLPGDEADLRRKLVREATLERFPDWDTPVPWDIRQIKGKGNAKPIDDYIPAVQDLVRNMGPWGEIRDLENSGLIQRGGNYHTPEELWSQVREHPVYKYLQNDNAADYRPGSAGHNALNGIGDPGGILDFFDMDTATARAAKEMGYASGGSVGANIGAGDTVGLGTYAPSAQGQAAPRRAADSTAGLGAGVPQQQPAGPNMSGIEAMGAGMNAFGNNPALLAQLPTWDLNDPNAEADIAEYVKTAGAGADFSGAGAFLRAGPTQIRASSGDIDPGSANYSWYDPASMSGYDSLSQALGVNGNNAGWTPNTPGYESLNVNATMAKMNDMLKDYRLITGITRSTDDPERMTSEGLYKNVNGRLTPIAGRFINAPENRGWLRSESGGSFLQALMTAAPAVGGFAGIASSVAPGAYGAATSAIGNTATNAIINALGSYALTGNPTGALSSLFGAAGGAAGSGLAGALDPAYAELGKFIGTQAGRNIGKRAST